MTDFKLGPHSRDVTAEQIGSFALVGSPRRAGNTFALPSEVKPLVDARNKMRDYYHRNGVTLAFTFDGKLVGDIGEACAVEHYGMKLEPQAGIDGYAPDGRTIQVKAKGRSARSKNGIAFTYSEVQADHLLVFELDFENATGRTIYNGPERYVREHLPRVRWEGQKQVTLAKLLEAATRVRDDERLSIKRKGD